MRVRVRPLFLILLTVPFCNGCFLKKEENFEKTYYQDGTVEKNTEATINALISDGKEVSILPTEWMDYYTKSKTVADVDYYTETGTEISAPKSVIVGWTNKNETSTHVFMLATNKEMNDYMEIRTNSTNVKLEDLFAGTTYYYQIKAQYEDRYVVSKRFSFKTVDFIRTIHIDSVLNARDLGNKKTNDGKKRVKQGLVFRTANFDSVSSKGKTQAVEKYGIKTDLDLREQGPTTSPLGENVRYINNGVSAYGSPLYVSIDSGINNAEYQVAMRDNLKVFSDINNFPLAFHCAVGRDRTGTLAITLYLLLGINLNQIKQDYAVSFFSKACNNYSFSDYENSMSNLFKYFEHFKGDGISDKDDIYKRTESYCSHIGLSKDEIASIRNNLLEDIKK